MDPRALRPAASAVRVSGFPAGRRSEQRRRAGKSGLVALQGTAARCTNSPSLPRLGRGRPLQQPQPQKSRRAGLQAAERHATLRDRPAGRAEASGGSRGPIGVARWQPAQRSAVAVSAVAGFPVCAEGRPLAQHVLNGNGPSRLETTTSAVRVSDVRPFLPPERGRDGRKSGLLSLQGTRAPPGLLGREAFPPPADLNADRAAGGEDQRNTWASARNPRRPLPWASEAVALTMRNSPGEGSVPVQVKSTRAIWPGRLVDVLGA